MKKSLIIILCLLTLISCKTMNLEKSSFSGMIYDGNNEPVSGASVEVNGKKNTVSDMYGRFYLENLKLNEEYELTISKKDFETVNIDFDFQNITQVAYINMLSSSQLLEKAESAITDGNYDIAETFIHRAEVCSKETLSSRYLQAVVLFRKGNIDNALNILIQLSITYNEPYIYLFLADIYEYSLKDNDSAQKYLKMYLDKTYDPELEIRYTSLCSK